MVTKGEYSLWESVKQKIQVSILLYIYTNILNRNICIPRYRKAYYLKTDKYW